MIEKLSHLALFDEKLNDHLIVISPNDRPALNLFDPTNRITNAGAIDSIVYLCSMLGTDFTGKQKGLYRNVANLLLAFPPTMGRNATLLDLIELSRDKMPSEYTPAIQGLPPVQRRFFESGDFESRDYRDTKEQIRSRLNNLVASPGLDSLFTSQTSTINIFAELQKGSIILVDCALPSGDDSAALGCIFISEVMRAITERNEIDPKDRTPAFLYVDEAATFFRGAETIKEFLTAARQCKIGGIFAFHTLAQAGDDLRSSLMTNTATKLVSKRAVDDAAAFVPHMGFTPQDFREFMRSMGDYHFVCTIAGVADRAVDITVPFGEIDNEPKMTDEAYRQFTERNRQRVSGGRNEEEKRETADQQQRQEAPQQEPPRQDQSRYGENPQQEQQPPHRWTEADDLAMADALRQFALALSRKEAKRAAELQDHIDDLRDRKEASEDYYNETDDPSQAVILRPGTPRSNRRRPKKRRGPLV